MDKNNNSFIGKSYLSMCGNFWTELRIPMG